MREIDGVEEDEVSLFDLWQTVRNGWRWVAGGAALGAVGAGLALAVMPAQYEAAVVLQVGQVGQVGPVGQVVQVVPIEPPLHVIERIRSGGFQIEAANSAGNQLWRDAVARSAKGGEEFFSAQLVKNTQLIEIKAKSRTPADAGKIAEAIVEVLVKRHNELAVPNIKRLKEQLALAQERLHRSEQDVDSIGAAVSSAGPKDGKVPLLALVASIRQYKQSELFAQYQMISAALGSPATQPTRAVEPLFVGERPVAPKKGLIAVLGTLAGMVFGLAAVFIANARASGKKIS